MPMQAEGLVAEAEALGARAAEARAEAALAEGAGYGDSESRMRLRSIDVQLLRILEEMAAGRQETMDELRAELGLSDRDRAWPALLAACEGLVGGTFQSLALRLQAARPLGRRGVVLSTFHSAKGSEFDHVYALSEGWSRVRPEDHNDETHALYVALTRCTQELGRVGIA